MAAATVEPLHSLDQGRLQLEQQMADLDKMLDTWRKWETDYEVLKEDIVSVRPKTPDSLASLASEFSGTILNQEEIQKLLTAPDGKQRSTKQVVDLIKHRLEYVKGNVDSLSKRRQTLEERLGEENDDDEQVLTLDMADQEGLPLTEIVEELDDDGNVISSSTRTPNDDFAKKVQKPLDTAIKGGDSSSTTSSTSQVPSPPQNAESTGQRRSGDVAQAAAKARAEELAASLEKHDDDDDSGEEQESAQLATAQLLNSIADVTYSGDSSLGPTLTRKPEEQQPVAVRVRAPEAKQQPKTPEGESIEDALLRQDMLDYSLHEVGAVVAEMDLEEASDENFDELEEYDEEVTDEEESEEDEYGRSLRPGITEKYKQEMMELEKKLNAGRIMNLGPEPGRISPDSDTAPTTSPADTMGTHIKKRPAAPAKGAMKKPHLSESKLRGVRFAENLDISDNTTKPLETKDEEEKEAKDFTEESVAANPLADEVMERDAALVSTSAPAPPEKSRRTSRFKATRASASELPTKGKAPNFPATAASAQRFAGPLLEVTESKPVERHETPQGPTGATHADVVERGSPQQPSVPDDENDDPELQRRQIAGDYYAKRNAMIQAQGGFTASDPEAVRVDENGDEVTTKISRFKAARLGQKQ